MCTSMVVTVVTLNVTTLLVVTQDVIHLRFFLQFILFTKLSVISLKVTFSDEGNRFKFVNAACSAKISPIIVTPLR